MEDTEAISLVSVSLKGIEDDPVDSVCMKDVKDKTFCAV